MSDTWEPDEEELRVMMSSAAETLEPTHLISWRRLDCPDEAYTPPPGLLAHFAHDFLQPLTALRLGLTEVHESLDETQGETSGALEDLEAAYRQLEELVRALADADALDTQDLEARHAWIDVTGLIEEVVRSFQPVARARQARVGGHLPSRRIYAMTDRRLLMRLVSNLLDNAIRHGRPGGHVTVFAEVDGDLLRLRVEDDGPGVPDELEVTPEGTRRGRGGFGLGLLLCARVSQLLSGHLSTSEGPGGRFMLEIPGCAKLR